MKWILAALTFAFSSLIHAATLDYASIETITSKALSSGREFYVKLPESYAKNPLRKYPVLYVLHGQWDTLPAVSTLSLLEGEIPEFILIGVQSRGLELRPSESGSGSRETPFAHFLLKELVPHIEKHYRVAPYRILSGHSNSGRFVMNSWLDNGRDFSAYYAFSPSMEDGAINNRAKAISPQKLKQRSPLTVTIASEGDHMQEPFIELADKLLPASLGNTGFKRFPEQSHSSSRHASLMYALQTTFTGWQPSSEVKMGGFAGLKEHYTDLSERFGFEAEIPLEMLQRLSAHYSIADKDGTDENTARIISYAIEQNPENIDAFIEVVDYLKNNGYEPACIKVENAICSIATSHLNCQPEQKITRQKKDE